MPGVQERDVACGPGAVDGPCALPGPADNGWRIFSSIDSEAYLADPSNLQVADFNAVCALEPALIGIYDFPVGSDLQIVDDGSGIRVVETATGREVPAENFFVPPAMRDRD